MKNNTINNAEKNTSEQLFRRIFKACDILRGPINHGEYKSYVTPIFFLRDSVMSVMKKLIKLWLIQITI